jgi:hypothetical protein
LTTVLPLRFCGFARPDRTSLTAFSRSARRFCSSGLTSSSLAGPGSPFGEGTDVPASAGGAAMAAGLSETPIPDATLRLNNPNKIFLTDETPGSLMPNPPVRRVARLKIRPLRAPIGT